MHNWESTASCSRFLPGVLLLLVVGCPSRGSRDYVPCPDPVYPPANEGRASVEQGIWGNVWFWSGDWQPICISGSVTAVVREVLAYEVTSLDSVVIDWARGPTFYSEIHAGLVAATVSDSTGFFEIELPPGEYSLFVREDTLFYANGFSGTGLITPTRVWSDSVSATRLDITYEQTM